MKKYLYIGLAIFGLLAFTAYTTFVYRAGKNSQIALNAKEQAKLQKRIDNLEKKSIVILQKAREEAATQRRKYNDEVARLKHANKSVKDWYSDTIPDPAVNAIWLRR